MKFAGKMLLSCVAVAALSAPAMAAEAASGTIDLVGVSGSGTNQSFTYKVTLTDTGTTNLSTFWYAWIPPDNIYDFLKSRPTAETSPTGWTANVLGLNNGFDNSSIQWVTTTNPLTPGHSLTFGFTTPDGPATISGSAPPYGFPVGYSYVYTGAPEAPGDFGALFSVANGSLAVPEPATAGILTIVGASLCVRRSRRRV